jgi:hypothetical protein
LDMKKYNSLAGLGVRSSKDANFRTFIRIIVKDLKNCTNKYEIYVTQKQKFLPMCHV